MLEVDMEELFNTDTNNQFKFLKNKVQTNINVQVGDTLNYYPFVGNWITKQKYNWQHNIEIQCNKSRDQFIILNQSIDSNEDKNKSIYIHGPNFMN